MLTPDCFKLLCMISKSSKATEVRYYFLEMERLIFEYYTDIIENLQRKTGMLLENQKPPINTKGGVLYIIEAQNIQCIDEEIRKYKIGRTTDIQGRLSRYNTGNANDIKPIWIMKTDDIYSVENCVKLTLKTVQYRKRKEVYEIDLPTLKKVFLGCKTLVDAVHKSNDHSLYMDKFDSKRGTKIYI